MKYERESKLYAGRNYDRYPYRESDDDHPSRFSDYDRFDEGYRRRFNYPRGYSPSRESDYDDERERRSQYRRSYGTARNRGYGNEEDERSSRRYTRERYDTPSYYSGGRYGRTSGSRRGLYTREGEFGRSYDSDYRPEREHPHRGRGWWDRFSDEVASWFGDEEAELRRRNDEMRGGDYSGMGPRNYQRSDERIREDVNDRLTDHPHLDASDIEVVVKDREVILTGSVTSRSAKRIAEEAAESVSGVINVQNNLRVNRPSMAQLSQPVAETKASAKTASR